MKKASNRSAAVPIDGWMNDMLGDPEFAAEYLNASLAEGDQGAFMLALRQVAKARGGGVAGLARDTGMARAALTRALSETGNPELRSLTAVLAATGLQLTVLPMAAKKRRPYAKSAERARKAA